MAHFYGTLQGARGRVVSRLGHAKTGLCVTAASWQGAVSVELYVDNNDVDCAAVWLTTHNGAGTRRQLYDGPVSGK